MQFGSASRSIAGRSRTSARSRCGGTGPGAPGPRTSPSASRLPDAESVVRPGRRRRLSRRPLVPPLQTVRVPSLCQGEGAGSGGVVRSGPPTLPGVPRSSWPCTRRAVLLRLWFIPPPLPPFEGRVEGWREILKTRTELQSGGEFIKSPPPLHPFIREIRRASRERTRG